MYRGFCVNVLSIQTRRPAFIALEENKNDVLVTLMVAEQINVHRFRVLIFQKEKLAMSQEKKNDITRQTAKSKPAITSLPVEKEWTIMVYMAGDNNLSDDMISQMNAIIDGLSHLANATTPTTNLNNVAFLAQYDGEHPIVPTFRVDLTYDGPTYKPMPTGKVLLTKAEDEKPTWEKVKEFIMWAVNERKAKHYALVISGHSDGFQGRTLLLDENPPGVETLQNLAKGIGDGLRAAGLNTLDLVCFDSCVMNSLEVIYEFKSIANIWIGSEGSIPNYTWDYLGIAKKLSEKRKADLTPERVASTIVTEVKEYNDRYAFQGRSIDISAGRLSKLTEVTAAIGDCFQKLIAIAPPDADGFARLARRLLTAHWKTQTYMREQSVDIYDYAQSILREIEVYASSGGVVSTQLNQFRQALEVLKTSVKDYVVSGAFSGGDYRYSHGLSLFMPWSVLAMMMSSEQYSKLNLIKQSPGTWWYLFIWVQVFLLCRPSPIDPLMTVLSSILAKTSKKKSITIDDLNLAINDFLKILGDNGEVRDDPPRNRGADRYVEYFGRTKNYLPYLEPGDYFKF